MLFFVGAAQLTLKSVGLGVGSTGGRGLTHEAGMAACALHGAAVVSTIRFNVQSLGLHACKSPSPQGAVLELQAISGEDLELEPTSQRAPHCLNLLARLSLLSPLEPRMTLAGLEPAIFGSEDQRLIH